ncbi:MAG: hypothetical protein E6Q33_08370 [Neisseriales bacterium]|jgi:hypothetical protein|nr:MAG: hypothetical protein E6Q33_08370 [Neisseriales bacterium]
MSKVSITEASKLVNISRATMYNKYINTGIISVESVDGVKQIDISELIRVFGAIQQLGNKNDIINTDIDNKIDTAKDKIITILESQLSEARDREKWLMLQLEKTTHLLENKQEPEKPKRKKLLGIF